MYHSVTFGDKNTYDDWGLVSSTRPIFAPPPVKTNIIDIPGSNGGLDLTDALNGYPVYENRKGSMEFIVLNKGGTPSPKVDRRWEELYSEILNYLHGKKMRAILEDDPGWYYEGRFSVNEWTSDKDWSRIVIDYDVYPYKKEIVNSVGPWEWDPFNFEDGVVMEYNGVTVTGGTTLTIPGSDEIVIPIITVESSDGNGMDILYDGVTVHLYDGTAKNPLLFVRSKTKTMTISGNGSITILYRGGSL